MEQIRKRRQELGLTQSDLVKRLNHNGLSIGRTALANWELGFHQIPVNNPQAIEALAEALEVDVQDILTWYGYNFSTRSETTQTK